MINRKIKSITKQAYSGDVYNLAVEGDETYFAERILVHNCRSTLIPIFIGEDSNPDSYFYQYDDKMDDIDHGIRPQSGFGG